MNDLRYANFAEVRASLTGNRLACWEQMLEHGPCTCTELASRMSLKVTSVRPRVTELVDAFHAVTTGTRRNHEHEFRAVLAAEAMQLHEEARRRYAIEERAQVRVTTVEPRVEQLALI